MKRNLFFIISVLLFAIHSFEQLWQKNLVMSLWDVPDAETSEFMIELYKRLFAGQDIEAAFYNTQATM